MNTSVVRTQQVIRNRIEDVRPFLEVEEPFTIKDIDADGDRPFDVLKLMHKNGAIKKVDRKRGYETWSSRGSHGNREVYVHRLLAVAEYGFDAVSGMQVHHENELKWDNRADNIELYTNSEHQKHHNYEFTEDTRKEIAEANRNSGKSRKEIGEEFGIAENTVTQYTNEFFNE